MANHEVVYAANYEALSVRPYFQLKYQPWLDDLVGKLDIDLMARNEKETGAFTDFIKKLGGGKYPIDYLMVSAFPPSADTDKSIPGIRNAIAENYSLLCKSPTAAVSVYRRNL
jgi:hypothetical protein